MNHSMINASVSLNGLQQRLDLIANNMANVNTQGYKKQEASFQEVLANVNKQPAGFKQDGRLSHLGYIQGHGARLVNLRRNMSQGSLQETNQPLDLAIEGDGLLEILTNSGARDKSGAPQFQQAWTRSGTLQLTPSSNGGQLLSTKEGHYVVDAETEKPLHIEQGYSLSRIDEEGRVWVSNDQDGHQVQAGRIKLVQAVRPQLLDEVGGNIYRLSGNVDVKNKNAIIRPLHVGAGNNQTGNIKVKQGFLEQSNVNLQEEMTELVMLQRAYQLNSRALTSSDTMMGLANNLRG